jgi:hypothetical protein
MVVKNQTFADRMFVVSEIVAALIAYEWVGFYSMTEHAFDYFYGTEQWHPYMSSMWLFISLGIFFILGAMIIISAIIWPKLFGKNAIQVPALHVSLPNTILITMAALTIVIAWYFMTRHCLLKQTYNFENGWLSLPWFKAYVWGVRISDAGMALCALTVTGVLAWLQIPDKQ